MNKKKVKEPWPTKDAMEQIYEMKLWGNDSSDFYSYLKAVVTFLTSFESPLIVCDLGCGDFNIGKELVPYTKNYIAVDIVADLIAFNKEKFQEEHLEFTCLDIATDDLPSGDCVLLRQVLQHLSNAEIQKILSKITNFKYIILTEHLPEGNFIPNKDIISGQGIRLKKQSGVNVLIPPFNLKVKEEKELISIPLNKGEGTIVTTLYTT